MIHVCNVQCMTMDSEKASLMGIDDKGEWLPFAFDMKIVTACKLASSNEDNIAYNCTTVFDEYQNIYIIDTNFEEFLRLFKAYNNE